MDTKVIPLSDFQVDTAGVLNRCYDSGQPVLVELPNRGLVSIQPVESDDDLVNDLIEHNPAFRALLEKSLASPRVPFPSASSVEQPGSEGVLHRDRLADETPHLDQVQDHATQVFHADEDRHHHLGTADGLADRGLLKCVSV